MLSAHSADWLQPSALTPQIRVNTHYDVPKQWCVCLTCVCLALSLYVSLSCRYAEPEYSVEDAVLDGDFEGSMDGLKKHKHKKPKKPHKKDGKDRKESPASRAERAQLTAAQRAAQAKVQVA